MSDVARNAFEAQQLAEIARIARKGAFSVEDAKERIERLRSERKWMVVDGSLNGEILPIDYGLVTGETVLLLDRQEDRGFNGLSMAADLSGEAGDVPLWLWLKNKKRFLGIDHSEALRALPEDARDKVQSWVMKNPKDP